MSRLTPRHQTRFRFRDVALGEPFLFTSGCHHRLEIGDILREAAFHRHQHLAILTRYDAVFPAR